MGHVSLIKAQNDWRDVGRPQVAMHRNCHFLQLTERRTYDKISRPTVIGGFHFSVVVGPAADEESQSANHAAIGSIVRTTCRRRAADDKWRRDEQSASLLASRLAVICDAEVPARRHISTSGRGSGDDVIVTWPVACR